MGRPNMKGRLMGGPNLLGRLMGGLMGGPNMKGRLMGGPNLKGRLMRGLMGRLIERPLPTHPIAPRGRCLRTCCAPARPLTRRRSHSYVQKYMLRGRG